MLGYSHERGQPETEAEAEETEVETKEAKDRKAYEEAFKTPDPQGILLDAAKMLAETIQESAKKTGDNSPDRKFTITGPDGVVGILDSSCKVGMAGRADFAERADFAIFPLPEGTPEFSRVHIVFMLLFGKLYAFDLCCLNGWMVMRDGIPIVESVSRRRNYACIRPDEYAEFRIARGDRVGDLIVTVNADKKEPMDVALPTCKCCEDAPRQVRFGCGHLACCMVGFIV